MDSESSVETAAACIARMTARLTSITDTPRLEAELLLANALGQSRAALLARLRDPINAAIVAPLLARRLNHEPLSYIFGEWEFFGLPILVKPPLLTPRPETEHLVETALLRLKERGASAPRILDVCCGTGCVGAALARHRKDALVFASDIRYDACELARRNAIRLNAPMHCFQGDLLEPVAREGLFLDAITANPPYVPVNEWPTLSPVIVKHEDPGALLAGEDGLSLIHQLIPQAYCRLRPGGLLALELGEGQYETVLNAMKTRGFVDIRATRDLAGVDRIISGLRD